MEEEHKQLGNNGLPVLELAMEEKNWMLFYSSTFLGLSSPDILETGYLKDSMEINFFKKDCLWDLSEAPRSTKKNRAGHSLECWIYQKITQDPHIQVQLDNSIVITDLTKLGATKTEWSI